MQHHDYQILLENMASKGIHDFSVEEIKALALAYWHEGFVPDVSRINKLSVDAQAVAGYLTEFFSCFNCISDERIHDLVAVAHEIKNKIKPQYETSNYDELAAEWGLTDNIDELSPHILQYQTRHYKHNPD